MRSFSVAPQVNGNDAVRPSKSLKDVAPAVPTLWKTMQTEHQRAFLWPICHEMKLDAIRDYEAMCAKVWIMQDSWIWALLSGSTSLKGCPQHTPCILDPKERSENKTKNVCNCLHSRRDE